MTSSLCQRICTMCSHSKIYLKIVGDWLWFIYETFDLNIDTFMMFPKVLVIFFICAHWTKFIPFYCIAFTTCCSSAGYFTVRQTITMNSEFVAMQCNWKADFLVTVFWYCYTFIFLGPTGFTEPWYIWYSFSMKGRFSKEFYYFFYCSNCISFTAICCHVQLRSVCGQAMKNCALIFFS